MFEHFMFKTISISYNEQETTVIAYQIRYFYHYYYNSRIYFSQNIHIYNFLLVQ